MAGIARPNGARKEKPAVHGGLGRAESAARRNRVNRRLGPRSKIDNSRGILSAFVTKTLPRYQICDFESHSTIFSDFVRPSKRADVSIDATKWSHTQDLTGVLSATSGGNDGRKSTIGLERIAVLTVCDLLSTTMSCAHDAAFSRALKYEYRLSSTLWREQFRARVVLPPCWAVLSP